MVLPQDLDDHHFAIEGTFVEVEMLWGVVWLMPMVPLMAESSVVALVYGGESGLNYPSFRCREPRDACGFC